MNQDEKIKPSERIWEIAKELYRERYKMMPLWQKALLYRPDTAEVKATAIMAYLDEQQPPNQKK